MFSYRHAFHAGNHADVLKHTVLIAVLRHLNQKDSPLAVFDTHAGAGLYRLDGDYAQTSGEAAQGFLRLTGHTPVQGRGKPAAKAQGLNVTPKLIVDFLEKYYRGKKKPKRRCHPRDILTHAIDIIRFERRDWILTAEVLDHAFTSCFIAVEEEI